MVIFNENSGFSAITILPIGFAIFLYYYINKKKRGNSDISKKEKDDLWHIVKKYLKMTERIGYEISDLTLYARPEAKELNGFIYKSELAKAKQKSKLTGEKYKKPKKEKKYEVEDVFQKLEQKTSQGISNVKRKIYVVCFRLKERQKEDVGEWECIEIELYKENNNDTTYQVKFNQELNYQTESMWIYPMQMDYLNDKYNEAKRKLEKAEQKEQGGGVKNKISQVFTKSFWLQKFKS